MTPTERAFHSRHALTLRCGPLDHQHGQAQQAGGAELGFRALASRVLGDDDVDAVSFQKHPLLCRIEGATPDDGAEVRERRRHHRRINQPEQVVVLRETCKSVQILPTDGKEHMPPRARKRCGRGCHIRHRYPAIPGSRHPAGALQPEKRCSGPVAGSTRVAAYSGGEGMGGIYDPANPFPDEIFRQPIDTPETTDPHGYRLRTGDKGAPGVGQDRGEPRLCHGGGKAAGFRRTAKDQGRSHG
ncbi:hypothetical protein CN97_15320 [Haematobacter massiliensis]|uniref:Uncharacterized protein n=1 Tax=Haematobacter massiliensis TaxID=195105 RepID=A0A086Y5I1_9RHOB|nr:hypothetical protein CN97_15320 [Haematobacter massiliensis]